MEKPSEKKCVCLRLKKKTCEENMQKKSNSCKKHLFFYKTKDIDCIEKNSVKKCRYSKYLQNETWNIKIDLLVQ